MFYVVKNWYVGTKPNIHSQRIYYDIRPYPAQHGRSAFPETWREEDIGSSESLQEVRRMIAEACSQEPQFYDQDTGEAYEVWVTGR